MRFPRSLPPRLLETSGSTSPNFILRTARPEDQTPLYQACYHYRAPLPFKTHFQRVLNEQEAGRCVQLVAEVEGADIIASGQLVRYTGCRAEVADLAVRRGWRGQGVGTMLIRVLARIARASGVSCLEIGVTAENQRALALYRRLGFSPIRELALCNGGSAVLLAKALVQPAAKVAPGPTPGSRKE